MGAALDRWRSWNAAKLPGRAVNRFVRGWTSPNITIEVHRTACIVTHPPGDSRCNALVNPANERLVGTRFSPEQCWKELYGDPLHGRWDSDLATYPFQSIDGLVTEFGGGELQAALEALPDDGSGVRCPTGSAVVTRRCGELNEMFDAVVHAVPPFYRLAPDSSSWAGELTRSYHAAFEAAQLEGLTTLAVPLMGTGARGSELPRQAHALDVAARAAVSWCGVGGRGDLLVARFGVQDSSTAHALAEAVAEAIEAAAPAAFVRIAPPTDERWAVGRGA